MKLPMPSRALLHGKAVEWERLEFKELDMTEGRSTGIPKILHAIEANGSPAPVFDFDEEHSFFMVQLPVHPQATMPEGLTPEVTPHVTPHVKRLLRAVHGEVSRQELMDTLNLTDRKHFSKEYLRGALNDELIEMTRPEKPRSVSQKYRLTNKGRALLKELDQ